MPRPNKKAFQFTAIETSPTSATLLAPLPRKPTSPPAARASLSFDKPFLECFFDLDAETACRVLSIGKVPVFSQFFF